jgi:cell wall-associated NlpC family hydrolase
MKKFLPILLMLLCSACATTQREVPVTSHKTEPFQNEAMNDLTIYAMSLAETPYQYGGNSPESGFDCSGFVRHVFLKSLGLQLPRTSQEMSQVGEPLKEEQLNPGDLVFFNTQQHPFSHVGIYVGENRFVHAPKTGKSIVIASMRETYWRNRFDGARRITPTALITSH